ncbi:MAG: quinoprotein dehydrogenase-associated putative ABC transporter substrate-binding protein [Gemmatimonadales bacterium]|nr:quinoprotein dehydrogenase-associated putative ABC transporter substrate-binding protein [Gemmatimonadales bacterium]
MSLRLPGLLAAAALVLLPAPLATPQRQLRVCADPNNLPFTNRQGQGFENRIAELVAADLHARLSYVWWAQRRGFFRNTLGASLCDVVMGVPSRDFDMARPTRPYYRSSYVFVTRRDRELHIASLDDPALRSLRIGVHLVGNDYMNTPPAHALSNRGIVRNVRGYTLYGDYKLPNPPARILEALARDEIDVAIVWGPLAGYFASRESSPLTLTPVSPQVDASGIPLAYSISLGVRKGADSLRIELDRVLVRRRAAIDRILTAYHVPRLRLDSVPAS